MPKEVLEVKCTFGLKIPAMKYIDERHSSRCWSQQRLNMGVNLESETRSDNGLSVQKEEWCKLRTTIDFPIFANTRMPLERRATY